MPFYHRVYSPKELPFITTSTYRHTRDCRLPKAGVGRATRGVGAAAHIW